jgi:DMSO/TMAO reductase YedYZ heme-binding membrane subunit
MIQESAMARIRATSQELPAASSRRSRLTVAFVALDLVVVALVALTSGYEGSGDTLVLVSVGDTYGLVAAGFLYLTLLVSPLALVFPRFPAKQTWFLARRGLGLSSLLFSLPHALVSFFGPLGGFSGVPFLDPYTAWALVLGAAALLLLLVLGATASDQAVRRIGKPRWKAIHRSVYAVGVMVLIHLLLVGTHYGDPHSPWMFWSLAAVAFLAFLQALRFDQWWAKKFPQDRRFGPASLLAVVLITSAWFWVSSHPDAAQISGGGVRWVIGHHGMVVPAAPPAPEAKP